MNNDLEKVKKNTLLNAIKRMKFGKSKEMIETENSANTEPSQSVSWIYATSPIKRKQIVFRVDGTSEEDRHERIKAVVDGVKENTDIMDLYEGLSHKKILKQHSEGKKIYEIEMSGYSEIQLIPEPDNKLNPNAIKVFHKKIGEVGYVPAEDCIRVREFMDQSYDSEWKLRGGKHKCIEFDEQKGKVVNTLVEPYGIEITLIEV